jgi:hypothetical protein
MLAREDLPMKSIVPVSFALALLGATGVADAQSEVTSSPRRESGSSRAAAVGATALYMPLKAGLCLFGGASSAFAYLGAAVGGQAAGEEALKTVANASCLGTWVITPGALRGREPIDFVGQSIRFPED